jgi:hypothetical protein
LTSRWHPASASRRSIFSAGNRILRLE